jgi:hypothetical protein
MTEKLVTRRRALRQCQSSAVAIAGFRQLAPIHDAGEKGHVAVVNLAGQRILGGGVGEHFLAELAERLDQFVAEPQYFDALVGAQDFEPLDVLGIEFGQVAGELGPCGRLDQRALGTRQPVPQRLVDAQRQIRAGLVEARVIVIIGDLIEPQINVRPRSDPLVFRWARPLRLSSPTMRSSASRSR